MNRNLINKENIKKSTEKFYTYDIAGRAASLAYFFILALFPFIMFLVTLLGMLPINYEYVYSFFTRFFSTTVSGTIARYYEYLAEISNPFVLVFGLVLSLYSVSRAVNALVVAVNEMYETRGRRGFIKSFGLSAAFTIIISVILILSVAFMSISGNIGQFISKYIRYNFVLNFIESNWINFVFIGISVLLLSLFYMFAPYPHVKFKYTIPGCVFCIAAIYVINLGVSLYVKYSTRFSLIYGSIGTVIIVLLWLYFFGCSILIGALLNRIFEIRRKSRKLSLKEKNED